jgi:hypothetical protein
MLIGISPKKNHSCMGSRIFLIYPSIVPSWSEHPGRTALRKGGRGGSKACPPTPPSQINRSPRPCFVKTSEEVLHGNRQSSMSRAGHDLLFLMIDKCMKSRRGGSRTAPTQRGKPLGRLIGAFKTVSTKRIIPRHNCSISKYVRAFRSSSCTF